MTLVRFLAYTDSLWLQFSAINRINLSVHATVVSPLALFLAFLIAKGKTYTNCKNIIFSFLLLEFDAEHLLTNSEI